MLLCQAYMHHPACITPKSMALFLSVYDLCLLKKSCCRAGREAEQQEFYAQIYAVMPDEQALLHTLLEKKEAFAHYCLQQILQDVGAANRSVLE